MKLYSKITALAVAGLISAVPLSGAFAGGAVTSTDTVSTATAAAVAKDAALIRTVDDAYRALREIRAARLSIFNGVPAEAIKLVNNAMKDLEAAKLNAKDYSVPTNKSASKDEMYVPFDMSMSLAEGFVPDDTKKAKMKEANTHIAKGDHKKAAEVLKLANIDVTVAAALIPAIASVNHINDAAKLIGEKKFYEANLALKAIEDSVVIESYGIDAVPVQGTKE